MDASSNVADEVAGLYRNILVAGPLPPYLKRKRDRTMSLDYGEYALELGSQICYGRVQGTDFIQALPSTKFLGLVEPSLNDVPTAGVSDSAFINMFPARTETVALGPESPLPISLRTPTKGAGAQDFHSLAQKMQLPVSKHTAAECAERKSRKKERREQEKQQEQAQTDALLVSTDVAAASVIPEQASSPRSMATKKVSKKVRRSLSTAQSHEVPRHASINPTALVAIDVDNVASAPVLPSPAIQEAPKPYGDLAWLWTTILRAFN